MSLPTNRQDGDVIENEDINALASAINNHEGRLTSVESDSGTSGSSNLLVVSGSVTLDKGLPVGSLVGYRATGSTTFTGHGGSVALAAGAYVFERVSGGWEYRTLAEGTGLTPPVPDTTNPTAGTLAVTGVTHNAATLTVTGASDNQALHGAPYAFSTNNGSTWTGYQSSNVYAATGLTPSTSYTFRHRVRDAAGNVSTGTAVTRPTTAQPVAYDSEVLADDPLIYIPFTETAWPFADVEGAATNITQRAASVPVVPSAQAIGDFPRSASFPGAITGVGDGGILMGTPAVLNGLTTFTFEALIRPAALDVASKFYHLISYGSSDNPRVHLQIVGDGRLRAQLYDEGITATSFGAAVGAVAVDQDYHVALTYDAAGQVRLYLDGVQVGSSGTNHPGWLNDGVGTYHTWRIGTPQEGLGPTAATFAGHMAGLAFHNTALSAARILAHAQAAGLA